MTVEVKLAGDTMKAAREQHMYDSTDVMRAALAQCSTPAAVAEALDDLRADGELTIVSTKVEAVK